MAGRHSEVCNELLEFSSTLQLQNFQCNLESCLSPSVYKLLCRTGTNPNPEDVLTSDLILDWSKLDLKGRGSGVSVAEYYFQAVRDISAYINNVKNEYQKLLPQKFATLLGPLLLWTQNEKVFLRAFELLKEDDISPAPILAGLMLTAYIEKALGDYYLLKSHPVPFLLKDLIASPEIEEIFGKNAVKVLQVMMGPPQSLNLRNILWHGFISPSEMDIKFCFFLLAIAIGLGAKLSEQNMYIQDVKCRKFVDFSASEILCAVFPDVGSKEVVELQSIFQSSPLIFPFLRDNWKYCLKNFLEYRYGESLLLLIPQFEHLLRVIFSSVNNCPEKVLTVEASTHFASLGVIIFEYLDDGKKNALRAYLGDNIMELLCDLFVFPEGPRVRDRISHGESDFFEIPKFLVVHLLSISAVICLKAASKPIKSPYLLELFQIAHSYRTIFHPFTILKAKIYELIDSLKNWKDCPIVDKELLGFDHAPDDFVQCDIIHLCITLVGESFDLSHLDLRINSYSQGLGEIASALHQFNVSCIYRPKIELQFCSKLRIIVHHSLKSSKNICSSLFELFNAWKNKTLRKRRTLTYIRLLKSLFTLYSGLYIVLILTLAHLLHINKCSSWNKKKISLSQKFLSKVISYTENMDNFTDPTKNMWVECTTKTLNFLNIVKNHSEKFSNRTPLLK